MTPREVHIGIDLGIQKLGSFAYDNIKPEYIDYAFNRMGDDYILKRTGKIFNPKQSGFEDNINNLTTVRELVTETSLSVYNINSKRQFCFLPHDYFSFIEAEATLVSSCTSADIQYNTTTESKAVAVVSFKTSDFSSYPTAPFSQTKIYTIINTSPNLVFNFADFSTGLTDIEEIFTVKNKILEELNRTSNLKVYWEQYNDKYYPNSLIFVGDSSLINQAIKVNYTDSLSSIVNFTTVNYTKVSSTTGKTIESTVYCRLISNEEAYHLISHPFGTTSSDSPVITIVNDKIVVYTNKRFILKGLSLKYIRKPRRMNLPLNQSYEIQDPKAVEKIIDMTAAYIAGVLESQGYQALAIENQQRD